MRLDVLCICLLLHTLHQQDLKGYLHRALQQMCNIFTMPYVNECWLQLGSKVALVLALRITQLSHVYFKKIFHGGVFLI